jgi:pimeloyl-ACP methyl ester carboxylesterase
MMDAATRAPKRSHTVINGVRQGMFVDTTNATNPVLLFVHGGPGMPEYWLTQQHPTNFANSFTTVWWEQRGAGLSFEPSIHADTMTVEQFVDDTIEVSRYLINRFQQQKIYLMGHSWGSFIAIQAVAREPHLYHAYVGVGQVTNQLKSERVAHEFALRHFRSSGNKRMVRRLRRSPPGSTAPLPRGYMRLRDAYMHQAGIGTTRAMSSVMRGIFLPSWQFSGYSVGEKVNLWRGKVSAKRFDLWNTMLETDVTTEVAELRVPAYFLHGVHDYTCSYELARRYATALRAPSTGFYTFGASAHSPIFEEPDRTATILRTDVLHGSTSLADNLTAQPRPEQDRRGLKPPAL